MPKFSVITICLNDAIGLASTIKSVGQQSYTNFEYIVQDGGSTDATEDVVKGFRDWIDIFNSKADNGIYDAMNQGIECATGDFVLFLNSADSFYNSETLTKLDQLVKNADEIVHGVAIDIDRDAIHEYLPVNDYSFGMVIDHQATVVKTSLLRENPFDTSLKIAGDLDFFSRCRVAGTRFRKIDLTVAKKPFEVGVSSDFLARFRERMQVLLKHFGDSHPELQYRLKADLLKYIQREFGSAQLSARLKDKEIPAILETIDNISSKLNRVAA